MASQDGAGRDVTDELTQIVRECVRNEIALQRSGSNTSFLMRTRDLIAMILLKGYFELRAGQSESEIRKSITEVLEQRFPFVRPDHFDFVKRELADRAELAIRSRVLINNEVWSDERESLLQYLCYTLSDFTFRLACSQLKVTFQ